MAQPGSLDSEAGIFAATFDKSGCRLITAEADKTIKIYKEDENAVCIACCYILLCQYYLDCFDLFKNNSIYCQKIGQ